MSRRQRKFRYAGKANRKKHEVKIETALRRNASDDYWKKLAGTTRLELATSAVTGQRSNQLNYVPSLLLNGFEEIRFTDGRRYRPATASETRPEHLSLFCVEKL
jgi:hypothetical protein